jgi:hypothetical protein
MKAVLWRQHRGQLLWTSLTLLLFCGFMGVVARSADGWLAHYHQWLAQLQSAGCPLPSVGSGDVHVPSTTCQLLLQHYQGGEQGAFANAYNFAIPVFEEGLPLVLVLIGILIGAPLVGREIEQRTQLVAWSQSINRRRWYTAKAAVLGAGLAVAGLLAGLANDRLQAPLTRGGLTSSRWPWFFSIDLTTAGETVLAFALAVALGAWFRRTLPAIGGALVGFLVLFLCTSWALRTFTPTTRATDPRGFPDNADAWNVGGGRYHSAGQYWPLQLADVALVLLLAGMLLAVGWLATRPREVV